MKVLIAQAGIWLCGIGIDGFYGCVVRLCNLADRLEDWAGLGLDPDDYKVGGSD